MELKFVHITKTGGTSIEDEAFGKGISWGLHDMSLKELFPEKYFWHIPFYQSENVQAYEKILENYDLFAVVRNPYTRIVSEYHWEFGRDLGRHSVKDFNRLIVNRINSRPKRNHYATQREFIYDNQGNQIVKHVLKFENLTQEFNQLMKSYNINMQLNTKHNVSQRKFSVSDLYPETIDLIKEAYHQDFEEFGYSKVPPTK